MVLRDPDVRQVTYLQNDTNGMLGLKGRLGGQKVKRCWGCDRAEALKQ